MQSVQAFAPATVANVSCGFDILGFAIDAMGDVVEVQLKDGPGLRVISIEGDGGRLPYEVEKNTCTVAIQAMLDELGQEVGMNIILKKGLPLGSGMGSSAASAVAALVAANHLLGEPFEKKNLLPFAIAAEKAACGAGHADNVAPSLLGGFVLIRDYHPLDVIKLHVPQGLHCTLLHPHFELKTSDSRSVLRDSVSLKHSTIQSGNVAGLIAGLFQEDFDLIGRSLRDVIAEPYRATLIPGFYEVKEAVKAAGALGMGISGSGPTLFTLSKGAEASESIIKAAQEVYDAIGLGVDTYHSAINIRGAYVLEST
ncbi:MAG: homoserine kinase [Algoriphagus sp.]|jgi:homoserine kinase|uniref:homoserine kinase n=1 Tax=Algoriphagus sp. TaxID=1872435 RepID=UPI00271C274D|nr:homoserine kinase [Algoriphagus sp.]MDO8966122.1 homoserine kinase [Algoriphagus sp.]MDP2043010.1 homoserine kinase [Algoriphagus sp.]MDP3200966.1 homoserine kinase [Algoriphagus sp.]MDP3472903.1 homoserine kinase [Algoriphagus sp.]